MYTFTGVFLTSISVFAIITPTDPDLKPSLGAIVEAHVVSVIPNPKIQY